MRKGFTLVELVVVLILMGLAIALVAPALRPPQPRAEPSVAPLLRAGRDAAVRRGEPTTLRVEATGAWRVDGHSASEEGPLATGVLSPAPGSAFAIAFSPLGTFTADIRSGVAETLPIDPLTCELRRP